MKQLLALAPHFLLHFHMGQLLKWWSTAVSKCGVVVSRYPAAWCLSGVFMHVCTHMQTHIPPAPPRTHTYPHTLAMLRERCFHPQCMHTPPCTHTHTHTHPTRTCYAQGGMFPLSCMHRHLAPLHTHTYPHTPACARAHSARVHIHTRTHTARAPPPCPGRDASTVTCNLLSISPASAPLL